MMAREGKLGKVVVRLRDGRVIGGFSGEERIMEESIKIISREGKEQSFPSDEIKAVFFVKDFKGDSEYQEVKFLSKKPPNSWLWVRVSFTDGEVIEGKVRNNKDLLFSPGLYVWPSDEQTNNEFVYVVKSAVEDLSILALQ